MFKKQSISLALLATLGLPQICVAENLTSTSNSEILVNNQDSLEFTENNFIIADRRDEVRRELRKRRREVRSDRRDRARDYRDYRRDRRSDFRDDVRDSARRARNRRTARRVIGGVTAVGVGAAIANQNRNYRNSTETIIIDQGDSLRNRDYHDDIYRCRHLQQGGYYDAYELEDCLRGY